MIYGEEGQILCLTNYNGRARSARAKSDRLTATCRRRRTPGQLRGGRTDPHTRQWRRYNLYVA